MVNKFYFVTISIFNIEVLTFLSHVQKADLLVMSDRYGRTSATFQKDTYARTD